MGNSNGKAKKAEEERLATQKRDLQEANCAAFMRASQKATNDVEDARLARLRDAEMAERAAHLADLKEAADNKVFFNNLLEEDAKLEQEKKKATLIISAQRIFASPYKILSEILWSQVIETFRQQLNKFSSVSFALKQNTDFVSKLIFA